ncbi:MAG: transposase [Candidatus Omnitrophota bacterium]
MPNILTRKQIRLKNYDYSLNGYYFVTICTYNKQELFGIICRGAISCALNEYGNIAKKYWEEIPVHYPYVTLDEYIIMPNHIHGIICINNDKIENYKRAQNYIRAQNIVPLRNGFGKIIPGSLGSIIRGYKIGVTKWFRINTGISIVWQKSFYEHVILNDKSLEKMQEYIINNPTAWENDEENINCITRQINYLTN